MRLLFSIMAFFVSYGTAFNCAATESTSFKLLDNEGKPTASNARCAISGGLTWELKTDDDSVHDKDNVYRWGGTGAEKTGTIFFDDWNNLLEKTNSEKLCGFEDWRVPTIDELKTLVMDTGTKPVIDAGIFKFTLAIPYWSVSTYHHYPEHAQTVDFSTGASNYYNGFRGDRLPVHLVRGSIAGNDKNK